MLIKHPLSYLIQQKPKFSAILRHAVCSHEIATLHDYFQPQFDYQLTV